MIIEIPVVPVPKWDSKPMFDYFEELKGYMIIINAKRDCRRIKLLTKTVKKALEKEMIKRTGTKPVVKFRIIGG